MRKSDLAQNNQKIMTLQESENIDLAEKGMKSPLNPSKSGNFADLKDKKTVLRSTNLQEFEKTEGKNESLENLKSPLSQGNNT